MRTSQDSNMDIEHASLREYLALLWRERLFICIVTGAFLVAATAAAFLLPKEYEATVLLAPNQSSMGGAEGALGSLEARFGGLTPLMGLSAGTSAKTAEHVAVLQSRALTYAYLQKHKLLPILFKSDWSVQRQAWKKGRERTLWDGNELFSKKIRAVSINGRTGLISVAVRWTNPVLAARWANGIVKMANNYLRERAIEESERDIAYLDQQAAKTNVTEAKEAIYQVLEMEMNREMLARGREQYAFTVIDPAVPPERPAFPHKLPWILGGLAVGLFVSLTLLHIRFG